MKPIFYRFNEMDNDKTNYDFHIHTNQTDGTDTIETILKKAKEKNIISIAFTEHVREETDWFDSFADNVRKSAEKFPEITVFVGCETKALDNKGRLDVTDKILGKCDIVLGSVHRIQKDKNEYIDFSQIDPFRLAELELEMSIGMLENSPIDVLAHPGGMYSSRYGGYPTNYFKEMMRVSAGNGKAIEVNSMYLKNAYDFFEASSHINPYISIGSDAHKADDIGNGINLINTFKSKYFKGVN